MKPPLRDTDMSDTHKRRSEGKPSKSGPPKGNRNSIRHGLKAGRLPKDAKYIEHRMNALRRQIESTVMELKGEINLTDAAYIQTAVRWERHAALAQRWLSKAHDEMTPEQRLTFSREIAKASAERDKALVGLKLTSTDHELPWLPAIATSPEESQP